MVKLETRARGRGRANGGITTVGAVLLIGKELIEAINIEARFGRPDLEEYSTFSLQSATSVAL